MAARTYQLKRRAERQAETRRRITEAAVELHTTVGPARTTISAIAERAGVQRHTVYAHFPDERALFGACSEHWLAENPFPDGSVWLRIGDPERRLRSALGAVYRWYERVEGPLALFERDATVVPAQRELTAASEAELRGLGDALAEGFPRRKVVRAAIGHALEFETWRSLARRERLSRRAAVELMLALVRAAA